MKLLTKYSRINILSSALIFLLSGVAFYILLQLVLIDQVDNDLKIEEHEIEMYVQKFNRLPDAMPVKDQKIYYEPTVASTDKVKFENIKVKDDNKTHRFRQLRFYIPVNEKPYRVFVQKSLEQTENISRSIIIISLATIIAMLVAGLVINRVLLRKLWQPFYQSLSIMKEFRLGRTQPVSFTQTNIDEFNDLNRTLKQSIESAESDYQHLKEFTENASHELQTPLAVIRSKMDILIQDEKLSERQSSLVQSTYEAIQKLARLNQSMLLLNKIENRQFSEMSSIDIAKLTKQKLVYFKELLDVKNITVVTNLSTIIKQMNGSLAEILLNNLFSNAIRYTPENGRISIVLSDTSLAFYNTAENGALDKTKLFNRFYKGEQSPGNHGLGLSIVKQICSVSGFSVHYRFTPGEHCFGIWFDGTNRNPAY